MATPSVLLKANTILNLVLAAVFLVGCVSVLLLSPNASPFALFGAVLLGAFLIVLGVVVYRSVFRQSRNASQMATGIYFFGAVFFALTAILNIGEALIDPSGPDWEFAVSSGAIGVLLIAYAVFSGILSLKWVRAIKAAADHTTPDV